MNNHIRLREISISDNTKMSFMVLIDAVLSLQCLHFALIQKNYLIDCLTDISSYFCILVVVLFVGGQFKGCANPFKTML